jgi:hypothetical protein
MRVLRSFADLKGYVPPSAHDIAAKISGLASNTDLPIESWAQLVIDCFPVGGYEQFRQIDEYPGRFQYCADRFWMLRRVRNHPEWGPRLFARLRGETPCE